MEQRPSQNTKPIRSAGIGAAIALGAVALLGMGAGPAQTEAHAVPNLPNASAQRFTMIAALERLDDRLAAMEKLFAEGELVVKISEMPEVKVAE